MKTLTKKEALDAEYIYCGYEGHEYQIVLCIEDLIPEDFNSAQGKVMLFGKEYTTPTCEENIKDFLADHIQERWWDETNDDTNDVRDAIMALDLSDLAERLNIALGSKKYYSLTEIQLLP